MRTAFRPLHLLFLTEPLVVYLKRADKSIRLACRSSPWQNGTDQQAIMPSRRPSELVLHHLNVVDKGDAVSAVPQWL
jgi:hypothetical protein